MYNVQLIHSFHCFEFIELTLTYVETEEGVCYLSLITDAYSHMIVGWAIGPTLEIVYQELERIILFYNTEVTIR